MMFSRQATLSAGGAFAVAIFVGIGCSNNVTTNDGSGGGKSSSSTVVTNATVTHSAATTSDVGSTTATSGTGGGTACDQACAKAAGCGFNICAQIPLNCGVAIESCAATCINNADCTAIESLPTQMPNAQLEGCIFACQQGGTGGAGGGGPNNVCTSCLAQHQGCVPPGCLGNMDCQKWITCAAQCNNQGPACFTACDTATPAAASYYEQFYSCSCTNCQTQCGTPMDPCSHLPQNGSTASSSGTN